jgi:hypothetical protein
MPAMRPSASPSAARIAGDRKRRPMGAESIGRICQVNATRRESRSMGRLGLPVGPGRA